VSREVAEPAKQRAKRHVREAARLLRAAEKQLEKAQEADGGLSNVLSLVGDVAEQVEDKS
jgi:hypothetical protein